MTASSVKVGRYTLHNVHDEAVCRGRTCMIHNPLHTKMDDWPLHWRYDRGFFERICACGVGHPDPSQFDYWRETEQGWQMIHGCCGHCA